ncbi:MAG TPA: hypothetical protein VIM98_13480 [Dyella sp.]|uniref:hypothetical protein n=1 Tax=Dyella sp. TaxID=1869338 RepID=UPI002F946474
MTPDRSPLAPATDTSVTQDNPASTTSLESTHKDYDRKPLVVEHFEHYIELNNDNQRFRIG